MLEAARDLGLAQEAGVDAGVHRPGVRVHLLDGDLAADTFVEKAGFLTQGGEGFPPPITASASTRRLSRQMAPLR